jgi:hypothetical protein
MSPTQTTVVQAAEPSRQRRQAAMFSVVIPSYNRKEVIAATLDSVLAANSDDIEVIVVDDGSTDGTLELLANYERYITILRQPNAGPGAARNLGAKHARGDYLAFLDSDDLWFPWTAETYATVVEETGRPAFIAGTPLIFTKEEDLANVMPEPMRYLQFADYLASGDEWRWFSASSFVVRRDVFDHAGGFKERRDVTEDVDLTLGLGTGARFIQIRSPATFAYREHQTSLKANLLNYQLSGLRYVIATEKAGSYPGGRERSLERRRIITRHARAVSVACLDSGHVRAGVNLYLSMFTWHLALARWKYLAGFPALALLRAAKRGTHA